jgi:hypothetical protein
MGKLVSKHEISSQISYSPQDFKVRNEFGFDVLRLESGGLTNKIGFPALPFSVKLFVLPMNVRNVSVSIVGSEWKKLPGRYSILPAQPPRPASIPNFMNKGDSPSPNPYAYWSEPRYYHQEFVPMHSSVAEMSDIPLPDAEVVGINCFAGRAVASIRIYPLRYNPAEKTVTYLSRAKLKILFEQTKPNPRTKRPSAMGLGMDLKTLISLVENPSDIKLKIPSVADFPDIQPINLLEPRAIWKSPKNRAGKIRTVFPICRKVKPMILVPPDVILTPSPNDWSYVIVTDDYEWSENGKKQSHVGNLVCEFEALARWKTMKGVRARVVSISDIMANKFGDHWHPGKTPGRTRDVQEAIHNFLKFAFENWNTKWCLLGGDENIVPTRHVLANTGLFFLGKDTKTSPDVGKLYFDSSTPALHFQAPYDFTADDVFVDAGTLQIIPYNNNADTTHPGWYWTQSNYSTHSSSATRYIVIRGNSSLLKGNFTVPSYLNMIPSDLYYGAVGPISMTMFGHYWDADANGIYGWWDNGNPDGVNFIADISVGRAPVKNKDQAHAFVEKVLTYERYTDIRTNPMPKSCVFGNIDVGTIDDHNDANAQSVSYFTFAESGYVTHIKAYISGASPGNCVAAIYAVTGGKAGTLLAQSNPVNMGTTFAWVDFQMPSPYLVTSGTTYGLAIMGDVLVNVKEVSGKGQRDHNAASSYDKGFATSFGPISGTAKQGAMSIYAIGTTFTDPHPPDLGSDYVRKLCCVSDAWGSNWGAGPLDKPRLSLLDAACQDKEDIITQFHTMGIATDLLRRIFIDIGFVPHIESDLSCGSDSVHVAEELASVNDGPHFLSVSGHGKWDGCAGFSSIDPNWAWVEKMTNWPYNSIYFVDSCLTNDFDADNWSDYDRNGGHKVDSGAVCLGKHLVTWNKGGAVGYVGYTRWGVVGVSQEKAFWSALTKHGQAHLGKMLDHARAIGIGAAGAYPVHIMSLMGDPELPVFTSIPEAMTVSHCSTIYGQDKLTVLVFHEEQPLTGVLVCVSQISDTDPLAKTYFPLVKGSYAGNYTFDTSQASDGLLYVVVSGTNYVPYVGVVNKVSVPISPYKYRTGGFVYDLAPKPGANLFAASGDNILYALSPNLAVQWTRPLNGPIVSIKSATDGSVLAGLHIIGNNLYLQDKNGTPLQSWSAPDKVNNVAYDQNRNTAYAAHDSGVSSYETKTGKVRWSRTDLGFSFFVAVDAKGDVYATGTKPGNVIIKLSQVDGSTVWSYDLGKNSIDCFLLAPDGTSYASTNARELHKIDPSGARVWLKTGLTASAVSLAFDGSSLYLGLGDGNVKSINGKDMTENWTTKCSDRAESILLSGNTIYIGSWHGVFALDNYGKILWFRETMGAVISLLQTGSMFETYLYAGSRDGWVYAIQLSELYYGTRARHPRKKAPAQKS